METQSPFSFFDPFLNKVGSALKPPDWVVDEVQQRIVLLLNHVLMQEPEAQARLLRQKGSVVLAQWRSFSIKLQATPAGLLDRARPDARSDLTLTVTEVSPFALLQAAVRGEKPAVSIEGDVQLAAEVNWLVEHVRWDLEEDLSRVVGDVPAHAMGDTVRRMTSALRQFVGARSGDSGKGGA
jgi:ubiquinone biosynthesis protein UbiJ